MVFGAQYSTHQQQLACVFSGLATGVSEAGGSPDQMSNQRRHAGCDRDNPEGYPTSRFICSSHLWIATSLTPGCSQEGLGQAFPSDLAAEIAGRLLAIDLTEYIRFRAVCKPWRQSTDDPSRGLDSRFFPRNWAMLSTYGEDLRRRLLNVATGVSIVDGFPELSVHAPLGCTEGLLVLTDMTVSAIRLFNPVTQAITDLPGMSSWSSSSADVLKATGGVFSFRAFGVIDGGDAAALPTVVMFLSAKVPMLAFTRLGEPHWDLVDTSELTCRPHELSFLSLHGRFYLSTPMGDVLTVELHPERPRLVYVIRQTASLTTTTLPTTRCYFQLAPSGNDDGAGMLMLMVLERHSGEDEDEDEDVHAEVVVFEVDIDGQRLIRKSTVGADRALFIGSARPMSISTRLFPSIAANANAVYFCHGQGSMLKMFHVFHIDDGRVAPAVELEFFEQMEGRGPFFGPFNLDVYLACCADLALGAFGI